MGQVSAEALQLPIAVPTVISTVGEGWKTRFEGGLRRGVERASLAGNEFGARITIGHALGVLGLTMLGYEAGDGLDPELVAWATISHDIGRFHDRLVGYMDYELVYTHEQYRRVQSHTWRGEQELQRYGCPVEVCNGARYHHEAYNGQGYEGLAGDEIPKIAQVVRIGDSVEAGTSFRGYNGLPKKPGVIIEELHTEMRGNGIRPASPIMGWLIHLQTELTLDPGILGMIRGLGSELADEIAFGRLSVDSAIAKMLAKVQD